MNCVSDPRTPNAPAPYFIAMPLYVLAVLLIVSGLFEQSFAAVAVGIIGLYAARVLQRRPCTDDSPRQKR